LSGPASSPLEVLAVEIPPPERPLRGSYLGVPRPGDSLDARELQLRGWVLGEEKPALGIEVVQGGRVVGRAPVELPRPDIAANHPDLTQAANSGFEGRLNLLAVSGDLKLDVRAVLDPMLRVPIATMTVRAPGPGDGDLVSVVIPCFEQAHFLGEAIESVLAQTHPGIEIIVVDDDSPDNTGEVAARYPGVRCLRQKNGGLAMARNTGLAAAEGTFVLFLDADDRLLPEAIATGLRELCAEPEAVMVAGAWRLIGENGEARPSAPVELPRDVYPALLESCFISTPAAVIYRRTLFEEIGDFDPGVSASADYDLYLRAAARFPVRVHGEMIAEYRRHGTNMTANPELILRSEIAVLQRQSPAIEERPELRAARERGLGRTRAYHGGRMVDQIRRQVDNGNRIKAFRTTAQLARLYPAGLPEALRALRRRRLR
jgi:hypothetical protein